MASWVRFCYIIENQGTHRRSRCAHSESRNGYQGYQGYLRWVPTLTCLRQERARVAPASITSLAHLPVAGILGLGQVRQLLWLVPSLRPQSTVLSPHHPSCRTGPSSLLTVFPSSPSFLPPSTLLHRQLPRRCCGAVFFVRATLVCSPRCLLQLPIAPITPVTSAGP